MKPTKTKPKVSLETLGKQIARDIFAEGDLPRKTTRIQFIGADGFGLEYPQGGMCEEALACSIAESLRRHFRQ